VKLPPEGTELGAPAIGSVGANEISQTGAYVETTIEPHGFDTTYQVQYGPTTSYGISVPVTLREIDLTQATATAKLYLGRLQSGTTYHYRVLAINADGVTYGEDRQFTTASSNEWKIGGNLMTELAIHDESLAGSGELTLTSTTLGAPVKVVCASSGGGQITQGGEETLALKSCAISEPTGCTLAGGEIAVKARSRLSEVAGTVYELFEPIIGSTSFDTLEFTGAECPLSEVAAELKGTLAAHGEAEAQLVDQPLEFSPAIQEAAGATLKLGKTTAAFSGSLTEHLSGENSGKEWGLVAP
jgi:hypothetical protein